MCEGNKQCDREDKEIKRYEFMFDLVKRRYDSETTRSRDIDGKAHNSVGYVSVIVGLLLGSGSLLAGGDALRNISTLFQT